MNGQFKLHIPFPAAGDQPAAIAKLTEGLKKGMRHQTLLGVTGSGKSVTPDTAVLVRDKSRSECLAIGDYVDDLFIRYQDEALLLGDTELLETEFLDIETYSVNPTTGKSSWKQITQVSRHHSPEELWDIESSCGRKVTATGDHNFYVLRDGTLILLKTEDVRAGDFLPVPRFIDGPTQELKEVNVTPVLLRSAHSFYAAPVGISGWGNEFLSTLPYYKRHRVALGERASLASVQLVAPNLMMLGSRSLKLATSPIQVITPSFLRLLGFYIGEGHATGKYLTISSGDEEIVEDVRKEVTLRGMTFSHRPGTYDYQINSLLWHDVLAEWCGSHSQTKQLPPFWNELSNAQLAQLLSAYFSADGGVDKNIVSASTVSKKLASELLYALLRFGIVARLKRKMVKVPGKTFRNEVWKISISGKDSLERFQEEIGFFLPRKQKALEKIIPPSANTNVDLIPIQGLQIKELRTLLSLHQRDVAAACGIERSYMSMLETGIRKPSYSVTKKLVAFFKTHESISAVKEIVDNWEVLLNLFWTPVQSIEKIHGTGKVYDFAVDGNETFLAGRGGMFVHNTYTAANVIANFGKPTLVMAHNKTLAAQLAQEYREFFPENEVHYFVSYYDYYQPEAYIAHSDTYIEKEAQINAEIDRLRHAATQSLLTRSDVIIVASVSAIYGLGSPQEYEKRHVKVIKGTEENRAALIRKLVGIYFERTNADLEPGKLRAVGNAVELMPTNERSIFRITFDGDVVGRIECLDPVSRAKTAEPDSLFIFPAKHFVTSEDDRNRAIEDIKRELDEQLAHFKREEKLLEAERIKRRTLHDLALIREIGYTSGIENYSRHFDGRAPGDPPHTLLSYFPHKKDGTPDFLTIIDESHVTVSQVGGMYAGDRSRKDVLVEHGFRLPSARDNRPLKFDEFEKRIGQTIYTTATPGNYEREHSVAPNGQVVEQIIRPTGLIDPELEVKPIVESGDYKGQVADFIHEAEIVIKRGGRALATTLTKQMAEDLSEFLRERKIKAEYLHSDIKTIERIEILTAFRKGDFDVLVGVNLLREGLDLPEVELVGILDADKEGFLRSETSLIQTIGRAARNILGKVILYADVMTGSMERAIGETNRRRTIQKAYNDKHGITPVTIKKEIRDIAETMRSEHQKTVHSLLSLDEKLYKEDPVAFIKDKRKQMEEAVEALDFETAALIRDEIYSLEGGEPKKKSTPRKRR
ncbi:MAG: UvrB, excinuclease subunit excinuclease subunit [Parcubacteria group bacterium]|nr:UvrB, excinuclease subunit excinuclease subunit [Parcubacteria group bacterium]